MKFNHVIGMDLAKEEFVLFVYDSTSTLEFSNTSKSIRKMLKDVSKMLKVNFYPYYELLISITGIGPVVVTQQL